MQLAADVVIVGGGPGGLAAAHAISRATGGAAKVHIFERSTASLAATRRGAGLGLDVNGQKALKAINPELHTQVMGMASFLTSNRVLRPDGSLVAEVPMGTGARKEYAEQGYRTPCLLGWSELQQMLAAELPDSVTLHLGMEFERYEESPDAESVTAFFKPSSSGSSSSGNGNGNGSASAAAAPATAVQVSVRAPLLVASDGYFSRVRRQCLADGPPEWGNTLVWRARLPAAAAAEAGFQIDDAVFVQDIGRFLFAYPISSGDVVWTVGCSDERLQQLGLDSAAVRKLLKPARQPAATQAGSNGSSGVNGGAGTPSPGSDSNATPSGSGNEGADAAADADVAATASAPAAGNDYTQLQTQGYCPQEVAAGQAAAGRCLQALDGFWEPVLQLVRVTPPSSLVEHGVYTRPASSITPASFGVGRLVIIGDAAHPLRPTGQGLNQTLEDAWGLGCAVLGSARAGAGGGGGGAAASFFCQQRLQGFRTRRAQRMAPVAAFTAASGRAAYSTKRDLDSEEEAAQLALGANTPEMSAQEFSDFCCDVQFEDLQQLAQQQQQQQQVVHAC